ncbi:hypothetical protein A3H80_02365 [Candidatus Roizmanbacteria bacterium RIFCSPLOWO2_02_FULL_37_19]|uniref:HD domain-containing protein n=1 Tax=Candidatus Roizmanbacteria bacterium RIFCSPHIGHO2_02_FULL_37_24 TaxID=1802037 RepID=A0A1F7GZZ8_9BACT|nr:MAG: hypothetical protein A2862_02985 [Candidatus Roizmanbacteria bacterium RIFCSPHIGHO2_01_FULL_38_41]OGK24717.1 MAG: hypothetical protein A3C24_01175 [Candidatus Roizmanbacteria bacterium RIFCSPHIGHO2_02_FULL_37_24]OGK32893.1 MAG: hypothetical protein A3E10_02920 [Candidatus Roizmanbacteria bacterium RIFCSPHIGHO2_12_FULL_37_23]OGK44108.1 MAG: hypothetical protein A2956_03600 [Candidatus Roizmanbacteria bacterium RIFCSPLOWO2_01_FULL_37_57]OGK54385.1 MAG: hypothetical protein A3H80_02365 [Ca
MKKSLKIPQFVENFMDVFRKNGYKIFVVGGAVRDLLLDRSTQNWDFTTNAKPDEIQGFFDKSIYNNDFGTVVIPIQNTATSKIKFIFEVTPFRKESSYDDFRHPTHIEWAQTIEEDLQRRDFTINALAYDGKHLIDISESQHDIEKKIIRAVGDPDQRFKEDALRLMRAIRFASELEFLIEEKTHKAIAHNAHLIQNISWERIREEFIKILSSDHPAEGIIFLKQTGLLKFILPELEACFSIEQKSPKRHHIYDVGTHSIETLRHTPTKDPITRFAALLHDIGKVETVQKDKQTGVITFHDHEIIGAKKAEGVAYRFRLSRKQKEKLVTLVHRHMFSVQEKQTDKAIRRFIRTVGTENLQDVLDLRTGDRIGSGSQPTSWRTELFKKRLIEVQKKPFTVHDLKITGNDVMKTLGLPPGPKIGEILEQLFEKVADGTLKNEKKILLEELSKNEK